MRVQKTLSPATSVDAALNMRFQEGFKRSERSIAEIRVGRDMGRGQFMAAYNLQFNRRGQAGNEHRLWQQFRWQTQLPSGMWENSARIEERYFPETGDFGNRLRLVSRWNKPVPGNNTLRLGYEWVYNVNDISTSIVSGISQNRLLVSLSHALQGRKRLDFDYQLRYIHQPDQSHRIQHQLQLNYLHTL